MKKIEIETIEKQYGAWHSAYAQNDQRARDTINFAQLNDQWDSTVASNRIANNKESLTFNLIEKHINRIKAQMREVEFKLNVAPTNKESQQNVEETNAFRLILNSLLLSDDSVSRITDCGDKCIEYGYSVAEINFEYISRNSLFAMPTIRVHKDPAIAFWDLNAKHSTRIDGRFAGLYKTASKEELVEKFNLTGRESYLLEKENKVYYYWFRDQRPATFCLLTTGEYKRKDLLDITDKQMLQTQEGAELLFEMLDADDKLAQKSPWPLEFVQDIDCIYFQVMCNKKLMVKPKLFPLDTFLPIIYHPGFTVWDAVSKYDATFPLAFNLMDPQKLHNYVQSQIATMTKYATGDKWIMQQDHVLTETQQQQAKEINSNEGAFVFGGDITTIRRETPQELPASYLQMSEQVKSEINEISGAMTEGQNSDTTDVSGVALSKITHNIGLMNIRFISQHIVFVRAICSVYKEMLPKIVTEERTLIVKKVDSSTQAIVVNQDVGTGEIKNNIKDINNNFYYDIVAGPSSEMQKENTIKWLSQYYAIDPTFAANSKDIFMRNLPTPDAGELELRAAATIDPSLIKYSQGEMSKEDYAQAQKVQQEQAKKEQQEMMAMDPNVMTAQAAVKAEENKGQAMQLSAETNRMAQTEKVQTDRMKIMSDAQIAVNNLKVKIMQLQQDKELGDTSNMIELLQKELDIQQHVIDEERNAAGE